MMRLGIEPRLRSGLIPMTYQWPLCSHRILSLPQHVSFIFITLNFRTSILTFRKTDHSCGCTNWTCDRLLQRQFPVPTQDHPQYNCRHCWRQKISSHTWWMNRLLPHLWNTVAVLFLHLADQLNTINEDEQVTPWRFELQYPAWETGILTTRWWGRIQDADAHWITMILLLFVLLLHNRP